MSTKILSRDDSTFWRQLDIVAPSALAKIPVTMIGVGGLGSPIATALAKMGIENFTIWDDDVVDEHNIPNQMYTLLDIGKPKVEAIGAQIAAMGAKPTLIQKRYVDEPLEGLVIVTVDSMAGRSDVWKAAKFSTNIPLLIDARMAAEEGRVFTVKPYDPESIRKYEMFMYTDEEANEMGGDLPCTAQSIIYNTFLMGSIVCRLVKGFAMDEELDSQIIIDSAQMGVYRLG